MDCRGEIMMSHYKYSASMNLRYVSELLPEYSDQALLPQDLVDISDEISTLFFDEKPPTGKMRIAGADGLPTWGDVPPVAKDVLIANAEAQRNILRLKADSEIAWLQDAVSDGVSTEQENEALANWKTYRISLMRLKLTLAPDIDWPDMPDGYI